MKILEILWEILQTCFFIVLIGLLVIVLFGIIFSLD